MYEVLGFLPVVLGMHWLVAVNDLPNTHCGIGVMYIVPGPGT